MKNYVIYISLLLAFISSCKTQSDVINPISNEDDIKVLSLTFENYLNLPKELKENSGLILYDNLLWTVNDSGGKNIIYGVNSEGEIIRRVKIKNASNVDWESITQDGQFIYIGDFGNNRGKRKDLCIYKVKKSDFSLEEVQEVLAEKITFAYQEQTEFNFSNRSTPYDCEAMISYNDNLYLFSKNWKNYTTTVYKVPKVEGHHYLNPLENYNVNFLVTAAHLSPDDRSLVILGYNNYKSSIWIFSNISTKSFFSGEKKLLQFDKFKNAQTEGICYKDNRTLLVSCEKTSAFDQQIFKIILN